MISASNWQCQALAASCSWRGRPSPPATWSQRCNKVSWVRLLYGAMSPPSTAALGVASWMASLAASRASRIASPENGLAKMTNAISGPTRAGSSSSPAPGSSLSRTSGASYRQAAPNGYGETFADLASTWRQDCSRRQRSARAMSASAGLPSQWPTAKALSGGANSKRQERGAGGPDLQEVAIQWPTPSSSFLTGDDPEEFRGSRSALAYADGERLEGLGTDAGTGRREDARRSAGLCDGTTVVHAERPEWWPHTERDDEPHGRHRRRDQASSRPREPSKLFPPGPSDLRSWWDTLERAPELEPAFRRVADGLASRLDIARVDRLRMLGNGVVSLEAAYALRTLATRLAARGAAGAARLVRMMTNPHGAVDE